MRIKTRRTGILRTEFDDFLAGLNKTPLAERYPLEDAFQRISGCSEDMQELMVSLLIEICADEVDGLSHCLSNDFEPRLDTSMRVSELAELVERDYRWACDIDLSMPEHEAQFWYVSAEKLEPRLGLRFEEEGADKGNAISYCALYLAIARRYAGCRWRHAPCPFHAGLSA